jgi:hypothetical protein
VREPDIFYCLSKEALRLTSKLLRWRRRVHSRIDRRVQPSRI